MKTNRCIEIVVTDKNKQFWSVKDDMGNDIKKGDTVMVSLPHPETNKITTLIKQK